MTGWLSPAWTVEALIASGLLMALVLALRGPATRAFGPSVAYALWLLPALRMVLPPLPGWRILAVPVVAIGRRQATVALVDPASAVQLAQDPQTIGPVLTTLPPGALPLLPDPLAIAPPPPHAPSLIASLASWHWSAIAVAVWLGGAAIFFAWQMARYHRFLRRALRDATLLSTECGIDVLVSPHVSGPVAAGIVRRRILLPSDVLRRYSSAERRLALKHEAAHHDRLDILANLVALTIVALHWWNPLAFRAYRAFRADQELACDATVLADTQAEDRLTYGRAMLKSASGKMPVMACALSHKDQLKQRIGMMAKRPMGWWRLAAGSMLAVAAVGGGLLITASGQAQAAQAPAALSPPVPPVPSAAPPSAPVASGAVPALPAVPAVPKPPKVNGVMLTESGTPILTQDGRPIVTEQANRETSHAVRDAQRDARRAEREARHAGEQATAEDRRGALEDQRAAIEAQRAAMDSQRAALRAQMAQVDKASHMRPMPPMPPMPPLPPIPDAAAIMHASLQHARAGLAQHCAAQGVPMPATADFGALATCGSHLQEVIRISLRSARTAIARDRSLTPDQRAHALAGLDRAMAETERELHRD